MNAKPNLPPNKIVVNPANIFERMQQLKKELESAGCKVNITCAVEIPIKSGRAKCRLKI